MTLPGTIIIRAQEQPLRCRSTFSRFAEAALRCWGGPETQALRFSITCCHWAAPGVMTGTIIVLAQALAKPPSRLLVS